MKTKLALVSASTALFLLATGCGTVPPNGPAPAGSSQTSNTTAPASGTSHYENKPHGYQFTYADSWKKSQADQDGLTLVPVKKTKPETITIGVSASPLSDEGAKAVYDIVIEANCVNETINGITWCHYNEKTEGARRDYYVSKDDKNYYGVIFTVAGGRQTAEKYLESEVADEMAAVQQILNSFKIGG